MHNLMNVVLFNEFGTSKNYEEEAVPEPTKNLHSALFDLGLPDFIHSIRYFVLSQH